jgi:hypothetical protein
VVDWYCMYKRNGKSVDHLLLHCKVSCVLRNAFFSRFGLSWVLLSRMVDFFACWWMGGSSQNAIVRK